VKPPILWGPLKAEIRLGGAAVGPVATVQGTGDAVGIEVAAGGDHLDLERVVAASLDLA
jgi:hypothetical protein